MEILQINFRNKIKAKNKLKQNENYRITRVIYLLKAHIFNTFQISEESFRSTHGTVGTVLSKYNAQEQTPHRQKLIWKLSSRTAGVLRPTDNFRSVLPAIAEHAPIPSPSRIRYLSPLFSESQLKNVIYYWNIELYESFFCRKTRKYARRHGNKRR